MQSPHHIIYQLRSINGLVLLDKPINITSNAALQKVKRLFHAKKAGHTGSLDPIATGMLPICFGKATKLSEFLLNSDKWYLATAKLGIKTTTGDLEGEPVKVRAIENMSALRISEVLKQFSGDLEQIPPMFSALKYRGQPLYKLARQGIEIERAPRCIRIFTQTLDSFDHDQFTFKVHCSKGTYIRTLVEDIGEALGCGAHVIALKRLTVSPFDAFPMLTLDALEKRAAEGEERLLDTVIPITAAVDAFPGVNVSTDELIHLQRGKTIAIKQHPEARFVRLLDAQHHFLGMGEISTEGLLKLRRLLA